MTLCEITRRTELAIEEILPFVPKPRPIKDGESPKQRKKENMRELNKHVNAAAEKYQIEPERLLRIILRK